MKFIFNQVEKITQLNKRFSDPLSPDYDRWELMTVEENAILNAHIFDQEGIFEETYSTYEELSHRILSEFGGIKYSIQEWISYMINNNILTVSK
jgi:hypothetical protein